jgi:hypothetical protein
MKRFFTLPPCDVSERKASAEKYEQKKKEFQELA